jgi:hypothetical protein
MCAFQRVITEKKTKGALRCRWRGAIFSYNHERGGGETRPASTHRAASRKRKNIFHII